ncbi:hypothetical protein [Streptomyces sannanensis]|uniref:hypothetical protein n=1 Tax=Streptomyces sannanensis TaxID=285536 RepID=UPI0031EA3599
MRGASELTGCRSPRADVHGIAVNVLALTLPALQRGEPWQRLGVDDPSHRRDRYSEPASR